MFQCSKNINMCLICGCMILKKADIPYKIIFFFFFFLLNTIKFFIWWGQKGLMRGRELNTDTSYQVVPMVFEGIYSTATSYQKNVVCCLKQGHGWFQKASFKNYIFNNNFQATLNTDMLPNVWLFFEHYYSVFEHYCSVFKH